MGWRGAAIRAMAKRAIRFAPVALLLISSVAAAAHAETRPKRIVSINACTDQLLFALADREQIAALTQYAVRDDFSIYTEEIAASGIKLIRGNAEEVLKLKPDLVLAGTFTRRATRELLQRHGLPLALFPPVSDVEEAKAAIRKTAELVGRQARGEALVRQIDAALAAVSHVKVARPSVLQIQRRGFVSGPETLIGDLLQRLGAVNAAGKLEIPRLGRASLEAALKAKADALVLFDPYLRPADQGAALLSHPALADAYPPERRIVVPGRLIVCAGPALPQAIVELAKGLAQLSPRAP
ncbi:MAG: ABC transporter substrate-binding protein [Rhodomicrobiaceae bacterium]